MNHSCVRLYAVLIVPVGYVVQSINLYYLSPMEINKQIKSNCSTLVAMPSKVMSSCACSIHVLCLYLNFTGCFYKQQSKSNCQVFC